MKIDKRKMRGKNIRSSQNIRTEKHESTTKRSGGGGGDDADASKALR